eukprot:TRINITY_DN25077_c0_g1_i1.p1 TRINITY_DN25077_c0_g1~~TRINITY_DN25077_c0_g1_i1.p1  ORF type:complete len:495 (+),score=23.69 TRINITY_DN25077_c0_g1_i1:46-1485(+)
MKAITRIIQIIIASNCAVLTYLTVFGRFKFAEEEATTISINTHRPHTPYPSTQPPTTTLKVGNFSDMGFYKATREEGKLHRLTTHEQFFTNSYIEHKEKNWTDTWPCYSSPPLRNPNEKPVKIWAAEVPRMTQLPVTCPVPCEIITGKNTKSVEESDAFVVDLARSHADDIPIYDWKKNKLKKVLIAWNIENLEGRRKMLNKSYKHRYLGKDYSENFWDPFDITVSYPMGTDIPLNYYNWGICRDEHTNTAIQKHRRESEKRGSKVRAACFFASNCEFTSHWRDAIVLMMRKYKFPVHGYGKCMNTHSVKDATWCRGADLSRKGAAKACIGSNYVFSLVVENSVSVDYVTEKVYEPLMAGSIPIYLGAPNVENFLPTTGCVVKASDFPSISSLVSYLNCVLGSPALLRRYQSWRERRVFESWKVWGNMYPPLCTACMKIRNKNFSSNPHPGFVPYVLEENKNSQRPFRECWDAKWGPLP